MGEQQSRGDEAASSRRGRRSHQRRRRVGPSADRAMSSGRVHSQAEYSVRQGQEAKRVPPVQGNPNTIAALSRMHDEYVAARKKAIKIVGVIFVCAACYAAYRWSEWGWWSLLLVVFSVQIGVVLFFPGTAMSEAGYRAIPGAADHFGRHVCIHCGGWGIRRKGEYKSDRVHAHCSKCQSYLWTE